MIYHISIPQRSDLNHNWRLLDWLITGISIPQRSDLNRTESPPGGVHVRHFNPATVWFEQDVYKMSIGTTQDFNPATVWFEPENARIRRMIDAGFQSRNGLIWTPHSVTVREWHRDFNPATVWFERYPPAGTGEVVTDFNPATVWFERCCAFDNRYGCY